MKKISLVMSAAGLAMMLSCDQVSQAAKEEAKTALSQTSQEVQKVIDDLGLV